MTIHKYIHTLTVIGYKLKLLRVPSLELPQASVSGSDRHTRQDDKINHLCGDDFAPATPYSPPELSAQTLQRFGMLHGGGGEQSAGKITKISV